MAESTVVILNLPLSSRALTSCADDFVWSRSCTCRSKLMLSCFHENRAEHEYQDDRERNREEHRGLLAVEALDAHDEICADDAQVHSATLLGGVFVERFAGELQEDLFEVGLANVQAEERRPGLLDGVQYLLDVVRVLHPDLDVLVVVMDRLEAHLPDDFQRLFHRRTAA